MQANLPTMAGSWLRIAGPESDCVMSTRVRLARNVDGESFASKASPEQLDNLRDSLIQAINASRGDVDVVIDIDKLDSIDRQVLKERHLISREHAEGEGHGRAVVHSRDESFSVMINEEDHLRLQLVRPGLDLDPTIDAMLGYDDALAYWINFAYDDQFGYLTACPTNCGTGIRISVMLHLPALTFKRHIDKVFQAVNRVSLTVRGLYGEGSKPLGNFYQISNQTTLGKSERDLAADLMLIVPKVIEYERKMRDAMMSDERYRLEDKIWRAYGLLKSARIITSEETMELLSDLRLGVNLGLIQNIDLARINELFVLTQPAHLQKQDAISTDPAERDERRARFIRDRLLAAEN